MIIKISKPVTMDKLKIPKGYRLIEDYELLIELRTNKKLQEIFKNGIWVNRVINGKEVIRASRLNIFSNSSNFSVDDRYINHSGRLRGVFVKLLNLKEYRNLKAKELYSKEYKSLDELQKLTINALYSYYKG